MRAYFAVFKYVDIYVALVCSTIGQFKAKVKVIMNHDMSAETSCTLYTGFQL